jgi:hypothetical protein
MSNTPPESSDDDTPDFHKVGFGAMGNVTVSHDASRHEQNIDNSVRHTEVTNIHPASDERGQWNVLLIVAVLLGLMGVVLALGLLLQDKTPAPPFVTPVILTPPAEEMPAPVPAIVEKQTPRPSAPEIPAPALPTAPVLELSTNKPAYTAGEVVELTLKSSHDGHVRILYLDAGGNTTLVLPNDVHDGRVKAGVPFIWTAGNLSGPTKVAGLFRIRRLRVSGPPFGAEEFIAVFSTQPFAGHSTFAANGFGPSRKSKAITLETEEVLSTTAKTAATAQARWQITTRPAP